MSTLEILFATSLLILFFSYGGYALPIWLMSRLKGNPQLPHSKSQELTVTLVVAAYNEVAFIEEK